MKKLLIVLVISLSIFPHAAALLQGASPPAKVVITFASFSEREGVLFVAQDHGFFRKYDLDTQLVYVATGAVSLSALSRGDSDLNTGSASGAILGAIAGGADLVFVGGLINKLTGVFVVSPQIKSPADLKGKKVGVTSIGGGNWVFTMLALRHWGLDPERDGISVRVIGNDAVRAQAVASAVIDGTQVGYAFVPALKQQGVRVLADLAELGVPYQGTALFTRRSFLNQSPETVEKVLRALVDSINFIQDPASATRVARSLAKWLRLARAEDAEEGYRRMRTLYERRIYPSVDGIRNTIHLLTKINEKIGGLKAEDLVDDRFVRKLEQQGLFRRD